VVTSARILEQLHTPKWLLFLELSVLSSAALDSLPQAVKQFYQRLFDTRRLPSFDAGTALLFTTIYLKIPSEHYVDNAELNSLSVGLSRGYARENEVEA
jgi:hypothetical protein